MKLLDTIIIFLLGVLVGIFVAGLRMSPTFHKIDCNDGMSEQVENGVLYKTYTPALDTCKEQK